MDGFINLQHRGTEREMEREKNEVIQSDTFSLFVLFFVRFWDQQPYKMQIEKIKRIVSPKNK